MTTTGWQCGALFVVGGAEDRKGSKLILRQFADRAGGPKARILVVGTASSAPDVILAEYKSAFDELGVGHLDLTAPQTRAEVDDPKLVETLDRATGVYFTGGDQLRLVSTLGGTEFARRLRWRFTEGLHLGGSSAGASAMSSVMIGRGRGKRTPRLSSVRLAPGLGILPRVIVDQHFRERDRLGRLVTAVIEHPGLLGFGVDEDTAFVVDPQGEVGVIGKGTLTIVDGHHLVGSNIAEVRDHQPLAFSGIHLHSLAQGWRYDINTREVQLPRPTAGLLRVAAQ